jgi:hypothetical protein
MSRNKLNWNGFPGGNGDSPASTRDADLLVSPDLLETVLKNIRNLELPHPERTKVSKTYVENILQRELGSLGQDGLSKYQNNLRTPHNIKILDNLDESIKSARETLAATPPNSSFRGVHHNSLGILLRWSTRQVPP